MKTCPTCKQTLPRPTHYGLKLTSGYRQLLEAVQRAGPEGIDAHDLFDIVYPGEDGGADNNTLRMRIYHLNKMLVPAKRRIASQGSTTRSYGFYYIKEIGK